MDVFRVIVYLAIAIAAANAIKCYHCDSDVQEDCYNISKGETKYLIDCPEENKYCTVYDNLHYSKLGHLYRKRRCSKQSRCGVSMSSVGCCRCDTDACNYGRLCDSQPAAISQKFSCVIATVIISICI